MLLYQFFGIHRALSLASVTCCWLRCDAPLSAPRDRAHSRWFFVLIPWVSLRATSYGRLLVVDPWQNKRWDNTHIGSYCWQGLLRDQLMDIRIHCLLLLYVQLRLLLIVVYLELAYSAPGMMGLGDMLLCWLQLVVIDELWSFFYWWFAHLILINLILLQV